MKKGLLSVILLLSTIFICGCNILYKKVKCTGEVQTKTFNLESVTSKLVSLDVHDIIIYDGIEQHRPKLEVTTGEKEVSITCQESLFKDLSIVGTIDKIKITAQHNTRYITDEVLIKISGYTFDEIDLAYVEANFKDSFATYKLEINLSSVSSLKTTDINVKDLEVELSGVSKVICEKISADESFFELSGVSSLSVNEVICGDVKMDISGASTLFIDEIICDDIKMDASGASKISGEVNINKSFYLDLSGASTSDLTGKCNYLKAEISGASKMKASSFETNELKCNISGASSASIIVNVKINGEVSGASTLYLSGNYTECLVDVSGASKVEKK